MKWIAAGLLAVALPACGKRGSAGTSADSIAVMSALEEYRQAWLKGDTAPALRRVSDDIRILLSTHAHVDHAGGLTQVAAEGGHAALRHRDVEALGRRAGAVRDVAASTDQIVHRREGIPLRRV